MRSPTKRSPTKRSLSPEARAVIDAAAPGEGMDERRHARHRRQLMAKVAVGAAATAATTLVANSAAATGAAAAPTKLVVAKGGLLSLGLTTTVKATVSVLAVGLLGYGGYRLAVPEPPPAPVEVVAFPSSNGASADASPTPEHATEAPPEPPVTEAPAPPEVPARPEAPAPRAPHEPPSPLSAPAARPPAARPSAEGSLAQETELLQEAQERLAAGEADEALDLLDRHAADHESGALVEERRAARVIALCRAGRRDEARAEASRFAADFPTSPQRARVLAVCREEN
ncbi:MAG: hypothetical protein R3B72_42740 [Polyangiaceae bacterium]